MKQSMTEEKIKRKANTNRKQTDLSFEERQADSFKSCFSAINCPETNRNKNDVLK